MPQQPRFTVTVGSDAGALLRGLVWRGIVRVALWVVAFGLGMAAAVLATREISSFWLGLYAFVITMHVVGRGLGQVITRRHRLQRAVYFALLPAPSIPVVWAVYGAWGKMWAAVLLGFAAGAVAQTVVGRRLTPRIRAEEEHPGMSFEPSPQPSEDGEVVPGEFRRLPSDGPGA